jgi:hypothetical protein
MKITALIVVLLALATGTGAAIVVSVLGCAKTKTELVLMPSGRRFFAFIRSQFCWLAEVQIADHPGGPRGDRRHRARVRSVAGAGIAAWVMPPV